MKFVAKEIYDFGSKMGSLPLTESRRPIGKRFANAGFDYHSFFLNSSDIFFIYFMTLCNFILFKVL